MSISDRLGCSTITFRRLPLTAALDTISALGFGEIDLGALPGVCDHVPYVLDAAAVRDVAAAVRASGLAVRSVNGDVGDLNRPLDPSGQTERRQHVERLLALTAAVGARALVLPNGALQHEPVADLDADIGLVASELTTVAERAADHGLELWVESLHVLRLCHTLERARRLTDALAGAPVGVVLDVSHVVASGSRPQEFVELFADRIRHVHLRDATPDDIHHSIGNGDVDFPGTVRALADAGYEGHFTLELETRDVADDDRPAAAAAAAAYLGGLLDVDRAAPVATATHA
ncbi:sugar phosphate isomerase/epimerase family protein [uncultured Friedmanniella sp.]|uniref:sugar phosphate isomerase/epimerase family protein n=1 Tax=uncultured Friedmanniella sp. TaxID=335381 RepID=UPI0035CA2609